ncbi:MAG: nuclear transport factor 2 family protein [Verrucomicrobiales bacterium]
MNRRTSILTGLSAATTLGALSSSAEDKDTQPANPNLEKIRAVLKAHDDAMTNHNIEGVLASLSPKAVIMGTGPGEIWSGPEEIKDAYSHFFADFDKGEQQFTYHVRMGELSAEMGWLFTSGEVRGKKGGKEYAFPLNVSVTVSKATGDWKIAALHFSTLTADAAAK